MPHFNRIGSNMDEANAECAEMDADKLYAEEEAAHIAAEHAGVSYLTADELTGYEEHCRDEEGAYGDPRRCARHPHVKTSSDDGMFDGVCGECEGEMDAHSDYTDWKEALVASGPTCTDNGFQLDRNNNRDGRGGTTCQDWNWFKPLCLTGKEVAVDSDEIPF